MDQIDTAPLLANLEAFLGFARRRTGDAELAAEAVQEALATALAHTGELRDGERLQAWYWRILRNTLHDALGRRGRFVPLPEELAALSPGEQKQVCACLADALATLPARQQEVIRRTELGGETPAVAAAGLGITPGNLAVIRHRARQALRERLDAICRTCATHGCRDCHCAEPGT